MEPAPLVLASASPRRRRLFAWLEAPYECVATDTDEELDSPLRGVPPVLARALAAEKARSARARVSADARAGANASTGEATASQPVILAFDTLVMVDGTVLGKPSDRTDAERMLRSLSGRTHAVVTGVALLGPEDEDPRTFAVTTPVTMRELDEATIQGWLDGDEVLGCAGAYNIERHLASVDEGECYQNVAGIPLCHVYERLARIGVAGTTPFLACEAARGVTCPLGRKLCRTTGA